MNRAIVQSAKGITLICGGPVRAAQARAAMALAPVIVAADRGADHALRFGLRPNAVVGDMDSISAPARAALADVIHPVTEQETTDFDKALRSIAAPFVLALGVAGGRLDHGLAALATLAQSAARCAIVGAHDVAFHAGRGSVALDLTRGDRFSLFPLATVTGESEGLDWPINGLTLSPMGRIGTSNRVSRGPVRLRFDASGMIVILPRARLGAVLKMWS